MEPETKRGPGRPKGTRGLRDTADTLRHIARARLRGWVQEDYPEGSGIKLTRYREVPVIDPVTAMTDGMYTERRTIYVVFFEDRVVAFYLREDLSPTVRSRRPRRLLRGEALDYLEGFGADPVRGVSGP